MIRGGLGLARDQSKGNLCIDRQRESRYHTFIESEKLPQQCSSPQEKMDLFGEVDVIPKYQQGVWNVQKDLKW